MERTRNISQSYANEAFVEEPGCNNSMKATTVQFDDGTPVHLISVKPIVEEAKIAVPTNDRSYDDDQASKRNLSKYNWKHFLPITKRDASNPAIDEAGCLSLMFMSWATPVIKKGFKRSLQLEDFDQISPYESAEVNLKRGMRIWNEEVERKGLKNCSMWEVLWKAVRTRIIFGIAFFVFSQIVAFLVPAVFLRLILEYIEKKDETSQLQGIGWVIGLFLSEVTRMAFFSLSFFTNIRTGARTRAMVLAMVYKKVSKLRNVGDKSIGEFVNLCASDADRIYQAILFNSFIFSGPIVIICTVIYTTIYIGPSALLGCGLFILFFPIQAVIGKIAVRFRSKVVFITDRRVRMMNEILTSIKLIKMYAWEKSFARAISAIRRLERQALTKSSFLQGLNMSLALVTPTVATVLTFFVHVASGKDLSSSQAYTLLTIFNVLVFSLAVLPFGVRALAEANIAVKRLQSLMVMEEIQHFVQKSDDPRVCLSFSGATFAWDKVELSNENGAGNKPESVDAGAKWKDDAVELLRSSSLGNAGRGGRGRSDGGVPGRGRAPLEVKTTLEPALFDVDLAVNKKTLVGICGSVGSGKSSLLQSLLGQMRMQKGHVAIGGSIAYVAQQAWIMNATLRDNILFGKSYDKIRYKSVCFACGLEQDLSMLPNGDMTEIGERGINLSGGQKQRVSLARALYADKDIYLLDDPLSAVDAHVGQHIFKHCIKGALWNKTILLATHQLQYLSQCDVVLYMKQGRIAERGSYDELICNNGEFASLIRLFIREVEEDAEETEDLLTVPELQRLDSSSSSVSADDIRRLFEDRLSSRRSVTQKPINRRGSWNEPSLEPFKHNFASKRSRESATQRRVVAFESADADADEKRKEQAGKLIHKEDRVEGAVTFATYKNYMKSGGGYCVFLFLMLFIVASLGGQLFIDTWLGVWLNAAAVENLTTPEKSGIVAGNPSNDFYVLVYLLSVVAFFLAVLLKGYLFVVVTLKASSNLHDSVFRQVSRATMAFFDTTPIGRILNRFSKDLDEIDVQLPFNLESSSQSVVRILISIGIIVVVIPWFLVGLAPLLVIFALINFVFNRSVRQLKRMDGITRSPIYSHLTTTVQGLATLHAYNKMDDFNEIFKAHVDNNTRPFFMFFASSRWLAVRLDMLTIILVTMSAAMVVLVKGTLPPAFLGLVLTYSLKLTNLLQFTVRQVAETEAKFTSVERIGYYIRSVSCEAEANIPDKKPPPTWPDGGAIVLTGIKMRYRDGLPVVLDNITCEIRRCEKVGIVGRTGSGKSSLGVVLWRLVEPEEGTMYIDNVDIRQLGLEDLRSRMSIIPQDPVLFVGTVRYNLDPFGEHSDDELWAALEKAHLREMVDSLPFQLMAPVAENGDNFSVGERQLICMARALLRHSKILLLDEATAAIDSETDAKIQDTIRQSFRDCTLLTIAHRLNTVMDSDRVMVMDKGKIVEFDSPTALLANPESAFSKLVQATDVQAEDCYLIQ